MKRSYIFIVVLTMFLIGSIISCKNTSTESAQPSQPSKDTVTLRLVMSTTPDDYNAVETRAMGERFSERTGGEYKIQVYTSDTLMKVNEYIDAVRTGTVEMADAGWGIYGGADPRLNVVETPFLFDNMDAISSCRESFGQLIDSVFQEKFNQKVLSCYVIGGFELLSKKPVKTLEDWDGLMVGCMSPALSSLVEALGGAPIVVMWPDLYSSLEKGVIEATLIPPIGALAGKLPDVAHNATIFYGSSPIMGYTINLDIWKAMSKSTQNILLEEVNKTADILNEAAFQQYEEHINMLKSAGVDVYALPKEERELWKQKCEPFVDEQISNAGDFGQKIKDMADKANAEYK